MPDYATRYGMKAPAAPMQPQPQPANDQAAMLRAVAQGAPPPPQFFQMIGVSDPSGLTPDDIRQLAQMHMRDMAQQSAMRNRIGGLNAITDQRIAPMNAQAGQMTGGYGVKAQVR